jgi:hypothetical protein
MKKENYDSKFYHFWSTLVCKSPTTIQNHQTQLNF